MKRCRRSEPTDAVTAEVTDIEDISFSAGEIPKIRASLLEWYDENRRDLPWRRISDGHDDVSIEENGRRAYAVWVSEVMLQQTRVQTVIDYFNRWMEKWPTINHLAQASLEEVNEMWAGLGYYRRARFLLEGAKAIVESGSEFPKTASSLQKFKGIGNYTAGAIASIAFKEAVPVVDGNVVRVLSRLKAISANPKDSTTVKYIWKLARQLVDPFRPGDFNQAVMELGATVCSPSAPGCSKCALSLQCQAFSLSTHNKSVQVTDYPMKVAKAKQRHDFSAVSVVEIFEEEGSQSNSKYLLVKRPDKGLLAGLWEFPSVLLEGELDMVSRRKMIDSHLKQAFGLDMGNSCHIVSREEVGVYVHVFTHIRLKMYVELLILRLQGRKISLKKQGSGAMTWKYVENNDFSTLGLTSGVRKVYTMIEKFKQSHSIPTKTRQVQQESSTSTVAAAAETKEIKEVKKPVEDKTEGKAVVEKPKAAAKAPAKSLPQLMEEDVIPSLKETLEAQQDITELDLSFIDNKLEGSFLKKGNPYSFWAFFADGTINGAKGFSISSYGSEVSTVEPFLVDEKKPTSKHIVFWVEKRLAAQGIIPVWKE